MQKRYSVRIRKKTKFDNNVKKIWLGFFLLIVFLFFVIGGRFVSLISYFSKKGRINFLIYDKNPVLVSFDIKTGANYYTFFPLDLRFELPGGYGTYRIGSLGKLSGLEKDREILKRSFSYLLGTDIDFYFYKDLKTIWYEEGGKKRENIFESRKILKYSSNAGLIEKLYLFFKVLDLKAAGFSQLRIKPVDIEENDINVKKFHKRIQGSFYVLKLREENKKVTIFYSGNFSAAAKIKVVLEGVGVDIFDIRKRGNQKGRCVVQGGVRGSFTLEYISRVFGCKRIIVEDLKEDTINLFLGRIEKLWR